MRTSWKILAPALIAATVPWLAGSAGAAPLSSSLSLKNADAAAVETVQWRRGHRGRWIGPAAGFAAGAAIGSAFAPRYYDYGYYGDAGYGAMARMPTIRAMSMPRRPAIAVTMAGIADAPATRTSTAPIRAGRADKDYRK
jgi:hypothetical protein